jgi:hypothetical protein
MVGSVETVPKLEISCQRAGCAVDPARRAALAMSPLLLSLVLNSCGWFRDEEASLASGPEPCPATAILEGADRTTAYVAGAAGESEAVRYVAGLSNLASECRTGPAEVEIDLRFTVLVEPGPAFDGAPTALELFVATVGPDARILSKRRLPVTVELEPGAARAGTVEQLTLALAADEPAAAASRRLFVGFQLDPRTLADEPIRDLLR